MTPRDQSAPGVGEVRLNGEQVGVLQELAPYELGEGWPNPDRPGEDAVCRSLTGLGLLSKKGRRYRITDRGRVLVAELAGRLGENL